MTEKPQPQKVVLKYDLTPEAVDFLLFVLNKVEVSGSNNHRNVITLEEILKNPVNNAELEKAQFEALKEKFEPKKEPSKA